MKVENVMEELAEEKLDEIFDQLDCCHCEQCKADILSYALNRLSPKYVDTNVGRAYAKLDSMSSQFEADLVAALCEGARIVKQHPRHSESTGVNGSAPTPPNRSA